jgi:hypothetical protein
MAIWLWDLQVHVMLQFTKICGGNRRNMEVFHIWKRHWLLTGVMLILAFACTGSIVLKMPRTYQADSTLALLASRNSSKNIGGGNPYLNFSNSLLTTTSVISAEIMSTQTTAVLKRQGFVEAYQVVAQSSQTTSQPAPFLTVTVTGSNAAAVERTLSGVTNEVSVLLNGLQSGMSSNNKITAITMSLAPRATLSTSKTARPIVEALAVLLVLALGVPLLVDAGRTRRSPRRGVEQTSSRSAVRREDKPYVNDESRVTHPVDPQRRRELPYPTQSGQDARIGRTVGRGSLD